MPNNTTPCGEAAKDILAKHPDMATRELARLLQKRNPRLFPNIESARSTLRYYRGAVGNVHRKYVADRRFVIPKATKENPFSLPTSYGRKLEPYNLVCKKALVIGDLHFPYQNNAALTCALNHGKRLSVDAIVLLGDLVASNRITRHEVNETDRPFSDDLQAARQFLYSLRVNFPDAKIICKEGNHDRWLSKFLMRQAEQLLGVSEFRLDVLLHLSDLRIAWIADKRPIKMGRHLNLLHGDEYIGSGGVKPAYTMGRKAKCCTLSAHVHRTDENTDKTMDGTLISNWTIGCLCELNPPFMPLNNHNLGFAVVEMMKDDNFRVHNHRVIMQDGKASIY